MLFRSIGICFLIKSYNAVTFFFKINLHFFRFDEKEVKSIFYNDNYIGCVISNEDEAVTHHISVYDLDGKSVLEKDFTMEYTGVEFLANNEICITNENACDIYTIHGIYKFHHEFEQTLYKIISEGGALNYTLILEDTTEKIRLK